MTSPVNLNQAWASVLVDELVRCGVREAIVCPGSRSAPLALAAHDHPALHVAVVLDERSAGFHALGQGQVTDRPTLVLTTSGTAVANLPPAVTEADAAAVPLLMVTADRPHELLDVGANQAIDQTRIFGRRVRWERGLGLPEATAAAFGALRTAACRAYAHAVAPVAGPVHLNVPLREPLAPQRDDHAEQLLEGLAHGGRRGGGPWARISRPHLVSDQGDLERVAGLVARGNGVILAGPRHRDDGTAELLRLLAADLDAPLLADPLSGVRYGPAGKATIIGAYDAFLGHQALRDALQPDWILQFGASPTSKSLHRWLAAHADVPRILVDERASGRDEHHSASHILAAEPHGVAAVLTDHIEGAGSDPAWGDAFVQAQTAALDVLGDHEGEGAVARTLAESLPPEALLFVGNSSPVRDLDRYGAPRAAPLRVLANRGASGIDGLVSTAAGAARLHAGPAYALLGDLSLQHDLGGLAVAAEQAPDLTFVVVDNGGGAIFDRLPVATAAPKEAYEGLFVTPQRLAVAAAAASFGLQHRTCGLGDLDDALATSDGGILQVTVARERTRRARQAEQDRLADVLGAVVPAS
ncbi:MAG: 2-succinyl-5-enolpyruvyl-6-hydroxy-3-cyclohexene-1-carboxylic-acid synthase [Thermoplasmatota archaeon]